MAEIKSNKSQSQTTVDMAQIVIEINSIRKRQNGGQEKKKQHIGIITSEIQVLCIFMLNII